MSILTKEVIQKILNDDWLLMDDCEGLENCTVIKELARMALAAMDSEPVHSKPDIADAIYEAFIVVCECHPDGVSILRNARKYTDKIRHAQPAPEKYNIGDATMRHIFTPTGMTDVSDMQAVFDRVESVLVGMDQPSPVVPDDVRQALSKMDDEIIAELDAEENACRAAMLNGGKP